MSQYGENECVICRVHIDTDVKDWVTLSRQGLETLISYSQLRKDTELCNHLTSNPNIVSVHLICRKDYTNKRRLEQEQKSDCTLSCPKKKLRSEVEPFNWKVHCALCGETARDDKHPDRQNVSKVQTVNVDNSLWKICLERNDYWALDVLGRLNSCSDTRAEDAIYHRKCFTNFANMNYMGAVLTDSNSVTSTTTSAGRPIDKQKVDAFEKLYE